MAAIVKSLGYIGALILVGLLLVVIHPTEVSAQDSAPVSVDGAESPCVSPSTSTAPPPSSKLPGRPTTTIVDNRITTTSSTGDVDEGPGFPYTGLSMWWLLPTVGLALGVLMRVADAVSSHRLAARSRR